MTIDLYLHPGSAPCRAVLMVAAALDLELNEIMIDLMAGDQFKPEFVKLSSQHTVPTLADDGFVLTESRAICRYLVNKYKEDSPLYPKDLKARALIDEKLDFDLGTLYPRFSVYFYPQIFAGAPDDANLRKKLDDALAVFDASLEGKTYAAGTNLTLADLALAATVSTMEVAEITLEPYPNVVRWLELVKSTAPKYEEANGKGLEMLKNFLAANKPKL